MTLKESHFLALGHTPLWKHERWYIFVCLAGLFASVWS